MKKYIFTESQMKKIVDHLIKEQSSATFDIDQKMAINSGSQEFLKQKGIVGADLTEKIKKYQKSIGCNDTGHMMDCLDIMFNKHRKDFDLWKSLIHKNKPIYDKIGSWLSKFLGSKEDPKAIY